MIFHICFIWISRYYPIAIVIREVTLNTKLHNLDMISSLSFPHTRSRKYSRHECSSKILFLDELSKYGHRNGKASVSLPRSRSRPVALQLSATAAVKPESKPVRASCKSRIIIRAREERVYIRALTYIDIGGTSLFNRPPKKSAMYDRSPLMGPSRCTTQRI